MNRFLSWIRTPIYNLVLIMAGSAIFAAGMNSVLIANKLLSGGLIGLSILFYYLFSVASVGIIYFLLNIPLIVLGWFTISKRFMIYTSIGMGIFALAADIIKPPIPDIQDPILASLLAGVICGAGAGIILKSLGSAGGLDILGIFLNKRFGLKIGSTISLFNAGIIGAGMFFFDFEMSLYSVIYVYTSGRMMDAVLTGFNRRKSMMVISDFPENIAREILKREDRGVTFIQGQGAFSGKDKKIIFTITNLTELPKMKELVYSIDPDAFMVVYDTADVFGKRHGKGRVF